MAKLGVLDKALEQPGLLDQVARFKAKFYPQKWARYDLAKIGTLRLLPPNFSLEELKKDYSDMAGMIYGELPEFDDLLEIIAQIERRINKP